MGQFLLSAGTPGKRYALPHSRILMHQGSAGIGGSAVDIEIQAENLEHTKNVMIAPDRRPHRAAGRGGRAGRAAGPLVHRRGGAATTASSTRCSPTSPRSRRLVRSPCSGCGHERQYTIPSVIEKTHRGERAVDIFSRLLTERIVYVGTEIDDGVANVVIAQLLHLESENPDSPIDLYLNSPGGSMTSMLAIYDAMEFIRPAVGTKCVGQAASTAAVLLAAGAPGQADAAAACPRRAPPAVGRRSGHAAGPRGGSQGDRPGCAPRWRRSWRRTPGRPVEQVREDTERDLVLRRRGGGVRDRRRGARQQEGSAGRTASACEVRPA